MPAETVESASCSQNAQADRFFCIPALARSFSRVTSAAEGASAGVGAGAKAGSGVWPIAGIEGYFGEEEDDEASLLGELEAMHPCRNHTVLGKFGKFGKFFTRNPYLVLVETVKVK